MPEASRSSVPAPHAVLVTEARGKVHGPLCRRWESLGSFGDSRPCVVKDGLGVQRRDLTRCEGGVVISIKSCRRSPALGRRRSRKRTRPASGCGEAGRYERLRAATRRKAWHREDIRKAWHARCWAGDLFLDESVAVALSRALRCFKVVGAEGYYLLCNYFLGSTPGERG